MLKVSRRLAATVWMAVFVLMVGGSPLAWAQGDVETEPTPAVDAPRLVLPHYMLAFDLSVEYYKMEIELAEHHGFDGFAIYFGAWLEDDGSEGNYVRAADKMFEAVEQLGTDFKLLVTPSWTVQHNPTEQIVHAVKRYYDHPNALRHEGRFVLAPYGRHGGADAEALQMLADEGYDVLYMPFTGVGRHEMMLNFETTLRALNRRPEHEGIWRFTTDDTPWGNRTTNANMRRATQFQDVPFMAGISFNYNSANLRDYRGLAGYGSVWEGIVHDRPMWVQPVTWNDFAEDTNLMHNRWKRMWHKDSYNRDGTYLDASAYWVHWYKTGERPEIRQDKLFFAYRDRSKDLVMGYDPVGERWIDHTMEGHPTFNQIHDDVRDAIYFSTFLTEPARLTVELAGESHAFDAPAGLWHGELPMQPGLPTFRLDRGDETLIDVVGRRSIIAEETRENSTLPLLHSQADIRQLTRIWAGSAAAGEVTRHPAAEGEVNGSAEVQRIDGREAVYIPTAPDAAVTVAVSGLNTSMYNIRFVYSNPGEHDARLTLFADGPLTDGSGVDRSDAGGEERYRIPLWLPPTEEGEWATATLYWTLFDRTSFLRIECHRQEPLPDDRYPTWNDRGDVLIESIELVEVLKTEPTPARDTVLPKMVSIPGGTFTMGTDDGHRTESPAREVTVSSFAIGKYPVTNEQFEQFMPEHRQWRDGFSWRDREPVIYIDWRDAARYCNWLSEQAGLEPAYDESDWTLDREANGFRLPTEAEWEYVATGRGEGRSYPWGDDEPEPMVHGNFKGKAALDVPAVLRSQEAMGTTVVGSFPAGASRDGVMDMAGNVMEWCSDWYHYYPEQAEVDPLQTEPSHSRVLRGGSWGYYGFSQRARAREFNSQNYPGYVYTGFRVALPEAGQQAIADRQ